MNLALAIATGFLSGSIPVGYLVAKAKGVNIRSHGSGNIGATNVGRVLGRKWGLLCFALDAIKGLAPTLVYGITSGLYGRWDLAENDAWCWLTVMVSPILGHVFCPWLGFRGGKGVSTAVGSLLGVFPALTLPSVGAVVAWFAVLWFTRYVSLSSIIAAWTMPGWIILAFALSQNAPTQPDGWPRHALPFILMTVLLAALVTLLHRANIKRIRTKVEPKVKWFGRGRHAPLIPAGGSAAPSA